MLCMSMYGFVYVCLCVCMFVWVLVCLRAWRITELFNAITDNLPKILYGPNLQYRYLLIDNIQYVIWANLLVVMDKPVDTLDL